MIVLYMRRNMCGVHVLVRVCVCFVLYVCYDVVCVFPRIICGQCPMDGYLCRSC